MMIKSLIIDDQWAERDIVKFSYGLSSAKPIYVGTHVYPELPDLRDMHYGVEFGIVLSGQVRRLYQNWTMILEPGDVWFCGFWEPHSREILANPYEHVYLIILPQFLAQMRFEESPEINWLAPFSAKASQRPQVLPEQRPEMLILGQKLKALEQQTESPQQRALRRVLLQEAMLMVFDRWKPQAAKSDSSIESFSRINAALEMVFEKHNYLSEQEAARACNMSLNSFNNNFKRLMGISFAKFSLRSRLVGAANELLRTILSPKTIASHWGFTDSSHLHRCFVEHFKCSPLQYRRKNQQG
jgi:AraC-like DNA-binding protein